MGWRTTSSTSPASETEPVLEDGRPTLIDQQQVYETARTSVERMVKRVGLRPGTTWPTIE